MNLVLWKNQTGKIQRNSILDQIERVIWEHLCKLILVKSQKVIQRKMRSSVVNASLQLFWPAIYGHTSESNLENRSNAINAITPLLEQAIGEDMKSHSGEKSHKCNQCNFASAEASNLSGHLKTHSGHESNAIFATMHL